jgi:hypothetical protein
MNLLGFENHGAMAAAGGESGRGCGRWVLQGLVAPATRTPGLPHAKTQSHI